MLLRGLRTTLVGLSSRKGPTLTNFEKGDKIEQVRNVREEGERPDHIGGSLPRRKVQKADSQIVEHQTANQKRALWS